MEYNTSLWNICDLKICHLMLTMKIFHLAVILQFKRSLFWLDRTSILARPPLLEVGEGKKCVHTTYCCDCRGCLAKRLGPEVSPNPHPMYGMNSVYFFIFFFWVFKSAVNVDLQKGNIYHHKRYTPYLYITVKNTSWTKLKLLPTLMPNQW